MSLGVSSRLKHPKKHELMKSHSQTQILVNKLRQDGVLAAVEGVMQAVEHVAAVLGSPNLEHGISYKDTIINLCQNLKNYGPYCDILYQDQLNRAFIVFRNSSQDDTRLDYLSRLHLLELIELRAKEWKGNDPMNQYYRQKMEANDTLQTSLGMTDSIMSSLSINPSMLGPGEIIKPSGKFKQPTRIPGKNYCKDEVVIRNADSGKVMGIKGRRVHMIEELSETIISFQRVNPGAKERLVQITGANEESINHAKQLIEDTIRRNASPVREGTSSSPSGGGPLTGSSSSINSSASDESALPQASRVHPSRALLHSLSTSDASIGEYKFTVVTASGTVKITGDNLDLVRTSKLILDEYLSGEPLHVDGQFFNYDSSQNLLASNEEDEIISTPSEYLPLEHSSFLNADGSFTPNGSTNIGEIGDDTPAPLRRPYAAANENNEKKINKRHQYSIEFLARLAMSPMCLNPPINWDHINTEYPSIARKAIEYFDVKRYLVDRLEERNLGTEEIDDV